MSGGEPAGLRWVGLSVGVVFGFLLSWARATDYDALRDMLLLRDPYLYLVMGVATAVALVGSQLLLRLKARTLLEGEPIAWQRSKPTRDTVAGSVLFGAGWALSGACVGPTAAQLGRGYLSGLFVAAGILAGVTLQRSLARRASPEPARGIGM